MLLRQTTLALATLVAFASTASAQTMQSASVTMVRTGWSADSFAVVTVERIANPAKCPTADGYISDKSLPGYQTLYAAALTALAAHLKVVITVHNTECYGGRPKLIGLNVLSS
jgi:hypothetical protein